MRHLDAPDVAGSDGSGNVVEGITLHSIAAGCPGRRKGFDYNLRDRRNECFSYVFNARKRKAIPKE